MNIFIVMGTAGEYSDRNEWPVIAYFDEEQAKQRVTDAARRAKELYAMYEYRFEIPAGANEFDKDMKTDYTGTSYFYYTVEVAKQEAKIDDY